MKKKLAILLTAVMTMAVAVPAFAHQVVVVDPSKEAAVEETEKKEETETKEETVTEAKMKRQLRRQKMKLLQKQKTKL